MTICPMMLARTFFDTRLAVGLFGWILGYGSVRPTGLCQLHDHHSSEGILTCHSNRYDDEEIDVKELESQNVNQFTINNGFDETNLEISQ